MPDDDDPEQDDAPTMLSPKSERQRAPRGAALSSTTPRPAWLASDRPPSSTAPRPAWLASDRPPSVDVPHSVPPASTGASASQAPSGIASASLTADAAVREEQAARGGAIVRVGAVVATVAAAALQLPVEQAATGRWVATGALVTIAVASAAMLVVERLGRRLDPRIIFNLGLVITPALAVVTAHVGAFSPASIAFIFGIYYFGMSDAKHEGWVCWGMSAASHTALTVLTLTRTLPTERSLFALASPHPVALVAMAVVIQLMFAATFWLARLSRTATVHAMLKLERAQREIRERDALLDEANQDLQQALAVRRGRFSGKQLGPFVAEEIIGRGAMGEVYAARHAESGEPVALKVLHAFMLDNQTHVERFFREAEISSELDSPHIVRVHGRGVADDGSPFLAMELLAGHDLAWHIRKRHRMRFKDALELTKELAQALSAAQDAGIVHRDLKPKNVFLDERASPPVWKILDFGVSKMRASSGTLSHGAIIGTPGYMAPEQARGQPVDHRADVFSLGAIAYRVLTGRPAFSGPDFISTMYQVTHQQPVRPGALVHVHADVDLVLALALAKDRERRLRSASSFAAALRDAARGELDARFCKDALELLSEHPWGERQEAPDADRELDG